MIFQSTPEPVALSIMITWWFSGNTAWGLDGQLHSAAVSALGLYAPRFYELWMVKDLNSLQSCTEKHFLWTDWQFSHKVWHKVVNHNTSLLGKTKPLVDSPFILNIDNLTCYHLNGQLWNSVTFNLFSLVLPVPTFLSVLKVSHSIVFYIYKIQLGLSVKNAKTVFSVLLVFISYIKKKFEWFNKLIAFLESVPTFMEMGFVLSECTVRLDIHKMTFVWF